MDEGSLAAVRGKDQTSLKGLFGTEINRKAKSLS